MTRRAGAMHVETSRSHQMLKDGTERVYERHLLRRSYRDGVKVRKETLANLSHLPDEAIEAVRLVLAGKNGIDAGASLEGTRSLAFGHSRDGKRGKPQIEYGLLTDNQGRPVAVRVLAGSTGDPTAFVQAVDVVREKFGITEVVMVGDRGMITSARVKALKEIPGMA